MTTFTVEHVDLLLPHDYATATATFLALVPRADPHELAALRTGADAEALMKRRAPDLGILVMTSLDQGPVVSLLGAPKQIAVYLIGSPVLGARIFADHPGAGLYAPAHVTIYADNDGRAHFAYDKPSTLLAQFGAAELGRRFDEKLATIGTHLGGHA
ncbi:MAG TPA: DUF302 domain-containing protein [Kofleriaceae bacterium]